MLCIIAIVLLYRIFTAVQDVLIANNILPSRLTCKQDILIPLGILFVFVKGSWFGPSIEVPGKDMPRWEFSWSDPQWDIPFIAVLVCIVLFIRIHKLLQAVIAHKAK